MVHDIRWLLEDDTVDDPLTDTVYLWDNGERELPAGVSYRST